MYPGSLTVLSEPRSAANSTPHASATSDDNDQWSQCVIPRTTKYLFTNEDQRNVFIWSSETQYYDENLKILAGFYQGTPQDVTRYFHPSDVYNMLSLVLHVEGAPIWLLKLPRDPRGQQPLPAPEFWHTLDIVAPSEHPTGTHRGQPLGFVRAVDAGHYILVTSELPPSDHPSWLTFRRFLRTDFFRPMISRRTKTHDATSAVSTPTKESRKPSVVAHTRRRDGRCRVSGETAPMRGKGYNFTGLEVAHIYPINRSDMFVSDQHRVLLRQAVKNIDSLKNTFLLRADIHAIFDAYLFSFRSMEIEGEPHMVVVRFEKDAAAYIFGPAMSPPMLLPTLHLHETAPLVRGAPPVIPENGEAAPDLENDLLRMHYVTALRWHVAGGGRKTAPAALMPQKKLL